MYELLFNISGDCIGGIMSSGGLAWADQVELGCISECSPHTAQIYVLAQIETSSRSNRVCFLL